MAFDVEGARKAGYSDTEIANHLAAQKTFDITGARKSGYGDQEIISHLLGVQKPKERTTLEAVKDVGAGLVSGAGALTQLPGQLYGLATGDFSDTGLTKIGRELRETGEGMKSEELKRREAERSAKIKEAGKEGEFAAGLAAFKETVADPALLTNFIAEQAPNLIPGFAVARGLRLAGAGAKAATAGAIGTGATQQGADIGAETFKEMHKKLVDQGMSPEEATGRVLGFARAAGLEAGVISLGAQMLPGGRAIERAMAKTPIKGGRILTGIKGGAGEAVSEMIEEGGGKVAQNLAVQNVDPTRSLTEGLGETMGMAAVGGLGLGTAAGVVSRREVPEAEPKPEPTAEPAAGAAPPAEPAAPVEPAPPAEPGVQEPRPPVTLAPPSDEAVAAMGNYWEGRPEDFGMSFADIQNRDRSRPASIQQMNNIAQQPDYNRLSVSRDFGAGAPVVISDLQIDDSRLGRIDMVSASDGTQIPVQYAVLDARQLTPSNRADGSIVPEYAAPDFEGIRPVAGNGRVAGIQKMYSEGPYGTYVDALMNDAAHGISSEVISQIEQPVLVRVMPKSSLTPDIADKSNVGGQLGMSPTEQAKIDMGRFDLQGIEFLANGNPSADSLRQFIAAMPPEEHGNLINAEGQPNPLAKLRLANALFARAYANDALIDLYAEATDPEAKQILNGMAIAAPAMSNLEGTGDYDIRQFVAKAAEMAVNARRQGVDLATYVAQGDIDMDPLTREVVSMFAANKNASRRIGDSLSTLAAEAQKAYAETQGGPDLFGNAPVARPIEDVFAVLRGEPTVTVPVAKEPKAPEEKQTYDIEKSVEEIDKEIDGMTPVQLADWLVDNAPNSFAKVVSEAIRSRVKAMRDRKIPMSLKIRRGAERKKYEYGVVWGWTQPARYEIELNGPNKPGQAPKPTGTDYSTILHEMLHLATQGQITIAEKTKMQVMPGPIKDLENLRKFIRKKVNEDRAAGRPVPSKLNNDQTLKNVHELISYGLTEIDVQRYLADINVKNKNAFTRFVDAIRRLLAISKTQQSALERLVSLTEETLEVPVEDIAAGFTASGAGREFGVGTPRAVDTRTPEFRKWFGDSKVVDENGDPLVVYHGTYVRDKEQLDDGTILGDIKAFDRMITTRFRAPSIDTVGSWFSTNPGKDGAEMYGNTIYPVYLSIKNPHVTTFAMMQRRARLLENGKDDGRRIGQAEVDAYRQWLKSIGKDGIKIEGSGTEGVTEFDNQVAWIALEPNQIKSVFNLRPTESPVITEARDTRTPEFTRWFGDSKIVDENGEPLRIYHGTTADITKFKVSKEGGALGNGIYATPDAEFAGGYAEETGGNVMPLYASIKNPLVIDGSVARDPMIEALVRLGVDRAKAERIVEKAYDEKGYITNEVKTRAVAQGYDGITQFRDGKLAEIVAFNPAQLKTVFNERPTDSPVITESRETSTPEFRKWFGKSKVVDENGEPRVMYHGTVSDFDTFLPDSHFGTARAANQRARSWSAQNGERPMQVMPVYLRIENPLKVLDNEASDEAALLNAIKRGKYPKLDLDIANRDGAYAAAKAAGYDGLVYQNKVEDRNKLSYVAFDANQIKSVFNLRPTESPVITEAREPFEEAPVDSSEEPKRMQDKLEEKWDKMRTGAPKEKPSSFEGVDDDLWNKISGTFFPQNKNIVQKIDGMRDRFWQRLAQGIADQYRTIKNYSEEAYMKARMAKTIDGALEGILFNGEVKLTDGALDIAKDTKGLLKVMEPVGAEVDRYQIWVALNRENAIYEKSLKAQSQIDSLKFEIKQLIADRRGVESVKEVNAINDEIEQKRKRIEALRPSIKATSINPDIVAKRDQLSAGKIDGKSRLEVYQQVQKDMNRLNRSVLNIALKQGLINREAYDIYANDINYIPFYKVMDEGGDVQAAATQSGLVNQYFSKALKGGEKPFGDLMENTLRNWSHILSASMKNEAANATIKAAMDMGGAFPNLKAGLRWEDGKVYSDKTDQMVGDGSLKPEYTSSDGKGLIKTMIDGKPAYFEVIDPLLLESIMSIGYMGPKSKFLDIARNFKNMLQFGVTLSPAFKIRNLFRDSISAIAVSDLKRNPFANVAQGWAASDRDNPAHISALAGGAIFNFGSAYEGDQAKLIRRLLDQGVSGSNILDNDKKIAAGLRTAWRAYQDLGNKSESANRMALYQQMRDKGMSHLEASFYARDLLDFSMQGAWPALRLLTQTIPFLNARVQGLYKLGRDGIVPTSRVIYNVSTGKPIEATDRQKAEQFSIVMSSVALASLMLYMAFKDDEEFQKREQWDRDNFWWFKLPGMENALRIPKPFEIGAFGTMVERVAEQIVDKGAEGKVFEQSLKRMLTDTFAINPVPQVFKPLLDLYSNKDSFTGAPIETAGMERLSKEQRIAEKTSPLAIALSKATNVFLPEATEISPVQADYAIKGYLGWLGGTASWASHYAVQPFSKSAYPDNNWTETLSMGFIKSLPATQSKYVTAFYENNKEISQAYADMRHFAQLGEADKVQEILKEKGDKIAMAKFYDNASKDMSEIRKSIIAIRNDQNMPGDQKKEEIDRLKIIIGEIARQMESARLDVKKQFAASQ